MSIVVIGNFDGVHKGHQQILNRAKALAGDEKIIALTFDPHPVSIFAPDRAPTLLTILSDRIELLKIHNADQVAVIKFTKEFAAMSPEDFVNKVLIMMKTSRQQEFEKQLLKEMLKVLEKC